MRNGLVSTALACMVHFHVYRDSVYIGICLMCAWTCEILHYYSDESIYIGLVYCFCNSVLHGLTLHMTKDKLYFGGECY